MRRDAERQLVGVEAVIDKDLASSLLARELGADLFVMATDVDGVYRDWGQPTQARIDRATPAELDAMDLPAGSMGPKVAAATEFVDRHGEAGGDRLARGHRRPGRRQRRDAGHGGIPAMTSLGVHSEVGKLRQVIVHRPDLSLKRLTPGNHDELLFDDVLWVERAQWEHDQFVARMRERGVEVLYVQDLLGEALAASDEARRRVISLVASEAVVGPSLTEEVQACLTALPPDALARHLIGGLTVAESGLDLGRLRSTSLIAAAIDDESLFVLPPLPNSLFTRDSSCWIYGGVSINPMYWPARRREAYNMATIYRAHPRFKDEAFEFWYPELGEDDRFRTRGLRPGVAGGRRRRDHRQGNGRHRDVRADHGPDDRAASPRRSSRRAPPNGSSRRS